LATNFQPPYLVRVGLVSASVGLATPLFAAGGLFRIWYSFIPKNQYGKQIQLAIGILIGGGGVTLVYQQFGFFLRNYSDLVFPFAIANSIAGILCIISTFLVFIFIYYC
jgi:hypothetical protein